MKAHQLIALKFIERHKKNYIQDWMPRAGTDEEILSRVYTNLKAEVYGRLQEVDAYCYEIEIPKNDSVNGTTHIFYFEDPGHEAEQIDNLVTPDDHTFQVRIKGEGRSQTNWLNINPQQLEKIQEILQ